MNKIELTQKGLLPYGEFDLKINGTKVDIINYEIKGQNGCRQPIKIVF